jgi:hypothetical protein
MTHYSIRKQGCDYIVLAGDQCILRVASRRKAVKLVVDAAELLSVQSTLPPELADNSRSIAREASKVP